MSELFCSSAGDLIDFSSWYTFCTKKAMKKSHKQKRAEAINPCDPIIPSTIYHISVVSSSSLHFISFINIEIWKTHVKEWRTFFSYLKCRFAIENDVHRAKEEKHLNFSLFVVGRIRWMCQMFMFMLWKGFSSEHKKKLHNINERQSYEVQKTCLKYQKRNMRLNCIVSQQQSCTGAKAHKRFFVAIIETSEIHSCSAYWKNENKFLYSEKNVRSLFTISTIFLWSFECFHLLCEKQSWKLRFLEFSWYFPTYSSDRKSQLSHSFLFTS